MTVCDDEESVIQGLELGGDDYVIKPFRIRELLSRIQANLRRLEQAKSAEVLSCDGLLLNEEQGNVKKGEEELLFRPVEYQLLLKLMKNSERIVKREELLTCLWDGEKNAVEDNTLSVHISRLRGKVGGEYIETVRGFGYRFTKKVQKKIL